MNQRDLVNLALGVALREIKSPEPRRPQQSTAARPAFGHVGSGNGERRFGRGK